MIASKLIQVNYNIILLFKIHNLTHIKSKIFYVVPFEPSI